VGIISLGCAKNLVDSEVMLGTLLKAGAEITNDASRADAVIVNTCSFIDSTQEESVDTILESAAVRDNKRRRQALIVAGCLPQRFRGELPKLLPEVDAFIGIDQVTQVAEIVKQALALRATRLDGRQQAAGSRQQGETVLTRLTQHAKRKTTSEDEGRERGRGRPSLLLAVNPRPTYIPDYATPRFRLTPRHLAYVKIAEGCNHPCSFCIIPQIRGSHRSRPQDDIVEEARHLLAAGVRELNLISQDSTYYGLDLRPNHSRAISSPSKFGATARSLPTNATTICTLLRALNALPGDFWIRLLYTHPAHWTDELIQTIAECPKVARYVDIPLQHIHNNMLERMRRETSRKYLVDLLKRIRAGVPDIALRTTFIVGFPGETEACFAELLDFIRETKFERLGVFTYSQEAGTRAGKMAGQIPDSVKRRRRDLVMTAQREIARRIAASFAGRKIKVLVEGKASAKQLQVVNLRSQEHGLVRERGTRNTEFGTGRLLVARGEADAPDIDGRVYVRGHLPVGEFAQVGVIGHTDYDLITEPAAKQ
jgi:ribosomal protein S12 methylthiotransferase